MQEWVVLPKVRLWTVGTIDFQDLQRVAGDVLAEPSLASAAVATKDQELVPRFDGLELLVEQILLGHMDELFASRRQDLLNHLLLL